MLLRCAALQEDTFEDEVLIDDGYDSEEPLVGEEEDGEGEGLDSSDGEGEEDSSAADDEGEEEGSKQAEEAGSDEGEWGVLAGCG